MSRYLKSAFASCLRGNDILVVFHVRLLSSLFVAECSQSIRCPLMAVHLESELTTVRVKMAGYLVKLGFS